MPDVFIRSLKHTVTETAIRESSQQWTYFSLEMALIFMAILQFN
jgi:hypothetical protein